MSQWHELPADKRAQLEELDDLADLRNALRGLANVREYWAGIPMPLKDRQLIIEPTYPHAKALGELHKAEEAETPAPDNVKRKLALRNSFWSTRLRSTVHVMDVTDEKGKRIDFGIEPGVHHFMLDLETLNCAEAWGVEQEAKAVNMLGSLTTHRQFCHYMLTGTFLEHSERSGVMYMFRRLKPTVALSVRKNGGGTAQILCTLCLHPIAYYAGSWAGAMCPTDDVIAHLMLMRGDEPMFWRRANQHAPHLPQAGL